MTLEILRHFLAGCILINFVLLLTWFGLFVGAHDGMYRLHNRWFKLSPEHFDAIHYAGMAFFKIAIWVFNLAPYLALRWIGF